MVEPIANLEVIVVEAIANSEMIVIADEPRVEIAKVIVLVQWINSVNVTVSANPKDHVVVLEELIQPLETYLLDQHSAKTIKVVELYMHDQFDIEEDRQ